MKCEHYDCYYTKGTKRFNKAECGWCTKQRKDVKSRDSCNKFELKKRTFVPRCVVKNYISDILTELTELRLILEAEKSENEEV